LNNLNILTLQPCKFTTSNFTQCCAKQLIARVVILVQPLDINDFSFGQPCAKASTPIELKNKLNKKRTTGKIFTVFCNTITPRYINTGQIWATIRNCF